jgi:hypothetical protein
MSLTPQPIDINFDITVDASSNIALFGGVAPDISGNIILATYQVPVRALYDASDAKGLIEFWEPADDLDEIKAKLADGSSVDYDFTGAYQKYAKRFVKQVQKVLVNQFDCSLAAPYDAYTSEERYYKQRDFSRVALGAMAHDLFGHVDATAAISNDTAFMKAMLSASDDASGAIAVHTGDASGGYEERYLAWTKKTDVAGDVQTWSGAYDSTDANLAQRIVKALVSKGLDAEGAVVEQGIKNNSEANLAKIVAQVLNQDISRLMNQDNSERTRDVHQLLKFVAGDKLYFNIKLAKPTVNINSNASAALQTSLDNTTLERTYVVKVVLYDDEDVQSVDNLAVYA